LKKELDLMAEIIKVYQQGIIATRFIGKKYGDEDRVDGAFGAKWGEWFENGWFDTIKQQVDGDLGEFFEDSDATIGLMKVEDGKFQYWIGYFTPENTTIPEGFQYIDFSGGNLGVCWVYGKESEVFMHEEACSKRLENEGFIISGGWCFERYAHPRFTTPDDKGNVTLDICFFVE